MIRYSVLGRIDMKAATSVSDAFLRRPKTLALLSYLLLVRPRTYQHRDRLIALFWPEQREARARHSLRQLLYSLRTELGEVIEGRGVHEVGVVRSAIWCDAVAFDDALAHGDLPGAARLYQGELLGGMSVRGVAPEFQDWLDGERLRYRHDAARAACGLAEEAAHAGSISAAVQWARRASAIAPLDEATLQRVLSLHQGLGHRAGAEAVYRDFARRMRTELDLQPSAELESLMAEIRGGVTA